MTAQKYNLFSSELESILGLEATAEPVAEGCSTPVLMPAPPDPSKEAALDVGDEGPSVRNDAPVVAASAQRQRVRLVSHSIFSAAADERALRKHFGKGTSQTRVTFHDPPPMSDAESANLAHLPLPIVYNPRAC